MEISFSSDGASGTAAEEEPRSPPAGFTVGEWQVEPAWFRLRRGDSVRKLEPRVMRLLLALAAAKGQPVTRQRLIDEVWPDVTVNEEALSRAVFQLRKALGDDPKSPTYVATVHKGGYSLIAAVRPAHETPPAPADRRSRRGLPQLAGLAAAAAVLGFALLSLRGREAAHAATAIVPVPLTSDTGREIDPAISRDGSRVVFAASTGDGYDLFWRRIGESASHRLTRAPGFEGHPVWSPSGEQVAYVGDAGGEGASIRIVDLASGAVETVARLPSWSFGLDWSSDGRTIAYSAREPGGPARIVLFDLAARSARTVSAPLSADGDVRPTFSPDGRRLAFLRDAGLGRQNIFVVRVADPGAATAVSPHAELIRGLDWHGDSIVYAAKAQSRFALWRIDSRGGAEPELVPTEGADLFNPSASDEGMVVAEAVRRDSDVWRTSIGGGEPVPIAQSTLDDYSAAGTADGRRLAFVSERAGAPGLWWSDRGGEPAALPSPRARAIGRPVWSPDGTRLAFFADRGGHAATFVSAVAGGGPRAIASGGVNHLPLGWSAGGGELIVASGTSGAWSVRRIDLASGAARDVEAAPARLASLSADRLSLVLQSTDGSSVLLLALDGRARRVIALPAALRNAASVQAFGADLYFAVPAGSAIDLYRLSAAGGRAAKVATLEGASDASIAPDGRTILFTRERETANDVVLLRL